MSIESKLKEMGIDLPVAPKPVAAYVPAVKIDGYVYTAGQIPLVNGEVKFKGSWARTSTRNRGTRRQKPAP